MNKHIGTTVAVEFYNVEGIQDLDAMVLTVLKGATKVGPGYFTLDNSYITLKHYEQDAHIMADIYIDAADNLDAEAIVDCMCVLFSCSHSLTANFSREILSEEAISKLAPRVKEIADSITMDNEVTYHAYSPSKYLN